METWVTIGGFIALIALGTYGLYWWEKWHHQKICVPAKRCDCETYFFSDHCPRS